MVEYIQSLISQALSFWNQLDRRQKIISSSIIAVAIAVIAGLLYWSTQQQWVVLYNRDLSTSEAAKISQQLEEMGAPVRVQGNIVKVPLSRKDELRMQLAQQGVVPSSTVGFEIFEKGSIGITDFERQVRYKRALQGELREAIRTNPKIEDAQVNIAMPRREAIFKADEKPVKASVKLQLKPYTDLDKKSIRGIINLVTYGVVGLKKENVVVTDQNDRILSKKVKEESGPSTKKVKQLEVKNRIEDKLEQKLMSSLGKVLTRDRISVAVTASMDFDRIEKRLEKYTKPEDAFEQLKASKSSQQKHLEGKNVQPGGPAGAESNIPQAEEVTNQPIKYDSKKSVVNYFANKTVTKIVKDPALTRISAVVTVDGTYKEVQGENGQTKFEYQPPSEEQMNKIREVAQAAIGFNKKRGDQIKVTTLQFDRSEELAARKRKMREAKRQRRIIYFVAGTLGLLLLIGLLFYWLRGGAEEESVEEELETDVEGRDLMAEVSVEEMEREETLEEIRRTAEEDPESVAQVLRSWFTATS